MLWSVRGILFPLIIVMFPIFGYSQVGPMGIGNQNGTATPAGPQPRLLLWLDGSSLDPYQNAFNLDFWNDKSGNEHNFTATSLNRPTVITGGGPSGTPALNFNFTPIGRRLECPDFELTEEGYTIFFVVRTTDDKFGLFSYSTPTEEREMFIYNDDTPPIGIRQQMDGTLNRISNIGDISDDLWNFGGIAWSSSEADIYEYTGGDAFEDVSNTFNGVTLTSTGSAVIGDLEDPGGGFATQPRPFSFEGIIAEIFIYQGRLSLAATRLLNTYLWVKYGIAGDTPAGDWEKFYGTYNAGLAGKYYAPVGIGFESGVNGGSINEARSDGLVLRQTDVWIETSYLCAAPVGSSPTGVPSNSVTSSDLSGTSPAVIDRWSRTWEIAGSNEGTNQEYQIAFDFGEGIPGGQTPQNKDNFVLLYRDNPTSGNFTVLPIANNKKSIFEDEVVFRVQKSDLLTPGRYYTIGTTDASSSLTGSIKRTWYAYQTGDWSDTLTWTLDGSAAPVYVNPGADTPGAFDDVYIGSGRNVTVDVTLPALEDLTVLGTLDLATSPQATFQNIRGSGLIRCAAGNFPNGNSTAFADPDFGGTLEFYGPGGFEQSTNLVVNRLKINLDSEPSTITLAADLTTNGLFELIAGTFIINNSASFPTRTLESYDAVLVENNGILRVSTASGLTRHEWYFHDDLINNGGEIRFTNRTSANFTAYSTNENQDIVVAYFASGSKNQRLVANGLSYFSRIVIDKGVDMTYVLSFSSNNSNHFKLLGPCDFAMPPANYTSAAGNQNSFALVNGTAEIRENIFIPLLTNNTNGIYNINNTAELWVNGGVVTKGRLGGGGNASAIVPYGNIRVTAGVLNALCNSGITLRENALVQIDGGEVNANSLRTSFLGADQIGGVIINGGVVNIDGTAPGGIGNNRYYTFCLSYPGNLFRMTGGILNVTGPSGGGGGTNGGLIFINSAPQNTSVSGGTVNLNISSSSNNHRISSTAAFWNLTLTRSIASGSNHFRVLGGTVGDNASSQATMEDLPLIVRNNLTITGPNNPTLSMEGDPAADLYVHGNLEMGSGSVYNHNNNTTHFVGSSNSSLRFEGSTTFPFHNVVVDKNLDSRFVSIQQTGPGIAMDILGNLNLEKGYFINNDRAINIRGNVTNRTQFGNDESTGVLSMRGNSGRQEIISDNGIFHRLRIDNPDGVTLSNGDVALKKELKLDNGSFFIGDNTLRIETTNAIQIENWAADRLVVCSGNASAGGLELLNHSSSQTLFYPIGVSSGEDLKFTWAEINVNSSWTDDGYIGVTPVDTLLSTVDLSGSPDYLNYYWKVSSSDYDTKPNVSHRFKYQTDDIRGVETNFFAGRVLSTLPFTRDQDDAPTPAHINFPANQIFYNGSDVDQNNSGNGTPLVDAYYSAGAADRFPIGSSPEI